LITFTATNSVGSAAQAFTLIVNEAPTITSAPSATLGIGVAGSFTVTTGGYPSPIITETGALPGGITFLDNGNGTGTLSGIASASGVFRLLFNAKNSVGSNSQTLTLTVAALPIFTSANTVTFKVGQTGSFKVITSGTPAATLSATTLPSGLTFVDQGNGTGLLSGTAGPGTGGSYSITFTATNSSGSGVQSFTLVLDEAPTITSVSAATFIVGVAGSFMVTTSGYPASVISETSSPLLLPPPSGISFVDNGNGTATLSGTPAAGGVFHYVNHATNSAGSTSQAFTLTINALPAFTSANTVTFKVGQTGSFKVITSGAPAATLSATTLPSGLTFVDQGNGTGLLSGTAAPGTGGSYSVSFNAANTVGSVAQGFTLIVNEVPTITSASSATITIGVPASFTITASGYPAPIISATPLPGGITLTNNGNGTGVLSGSALLASITKVTIKAANSVGSASQLFMLTVN
jgi:hypothetical protein